MKILHYALGFPPYRTGGMTKFCIDLLEHQNADGHQTALMWPGRMGLCQDSVSVKDRGIARIGRRPRAVRSFEVCGPLPVPYDEGITDFAAFTKDAGERAYEQFLKEFCPDVIHIHTLMGLHGSFLRIAGKMKIRRVFTAHDYFPICPKVTMIRHGQICTAAESCTDCGKCNAQALSINQIKILQSPVYRAFKDTLIVRKMRKKHRDSRLKGTEAGQNAADRGISTLFRKYSNTKHPLFPPVPHRLIQPPCSDTNIGHLVSEHLRNSVLAADYRNLRNYYASLLKSMDMIHYNSTITKAVYEKYFQLPNSTVIGISHGDIKDCRKTKKFSREQLRIAYLGPESEAKGFFLLQEALDELWKTDRRFRLKLYFKPAKLSPYMEVHDRYTYSELEDIFDHTDLLAAPSIWQETYGYTVLEALSYGVPVLISSNVGVKDILAQGAGVVIEDINAGRLRDLLAGMTSRQLSKMNQTILEKQKIPTLRQVAGTIEKQCYFQEP